MKQELIEELAKKWERDGKEPDYFMDGSTDGAEMEARKAGYRAGLRKAASDVAALIALLGE